MHSHDEGEDSEHSVEELEAAETLERMKTGSPEGKVEDVGVGDEVVSGAGVIDRGRSSGGWRVMDLG